jgi:DNA polymerase I
MVDSVAPPKVKQCDDCPVKVAGRIGCTDYSPGRGSENPKVVVIGEYPGEHELEAGKSFSGESGFFLHTVLQKLDDEITGASDIEAYEDNAIMCGVFEDEVGRKDEHELETAVKVCRNRLVNFLNEKRPRVIVLMGGTAVKSILFEEKVIPHLWKPKKSPLLDFEHDIIVTYNPASVLRNPEQAKTFIDSMEKAVKIVTGEVAPLDQPELTLARTLEDVTDILDKLREFKELALDLETTNLDPFTCKILSVAFSPNEKQTYMIPWRLIADTIYPVEGDEDIHYQTPNEHQRPYFDEVKNFLEDGNSRGFILHNATFDESCLTAAGIKPIKVTSDPMLLHYAIDERTGLGTGHGLKPLANQYFNASDWEGSIKTYLKNKNDSYETIPEQVLLEEYAKWDTPYTWALDKVLKHKATSDDLELYENTLLPFRTMLASCQARGVYIDIPLMLETSSQIQRDKDDLERILQSICGLPTLNPGSTHQVQQVLFGDFRLGRPTLLSHQGEEREMQGSGEPVLLELLKGNQEFLHEIEKLDGDESIQSLTQLVERAEAIDYKFAFILGVLVYRDLQKDKSTYIDGVAKFISPFDRCIHPFYHVTGTESGRFTGSRPSLLNVKNTNRLKAIYRARPGYKMMYADQSQMELRVFACITGDYVLADLLRKADEGEEAGIKGSDIHSQVGKMVFPYYDQAPKWWRAIVKTIVYGVLYGRSAFAIAEKHKIPLNDAEQYRSNILDLFPGVREYEQKIIEELHSTGEVRTAFGRKRRYPFLPSNRRAFSHVKNSSINMPIQGAATDINSWSMYDVWKDREETGCYPLWPIHDAVVFELQEDGYESRANYVQEVMVTTAPRRLGEAFNYIPFKVDPKLGDNWGEMSDEESFFAQVLALIGQAD